MARKRTQGTREASLPTTRTCGTMQVHERLLRSDASYAQARVESENRAWRARSAPSSLVGRSGVTVIPVVVHVVSSTTAGNISDAQINSQIDVLNRDYRKLNPDLSSLPPVFAPLAADARIEFELATTDPNGAATNGITRTSTSTASFTDDNAVKAASSGGADPWPADKYLNLWVCKLSGGLLGYAQFPGGPPATDGVVITHTGFGTTGTAAAPFNLGRTATHEIGHWLNLRHIWGDDDGGCNGDDFVADTPNAAGPNGGMPNFPHITCNNGPNGDLFQNYMDYTDDAGMFMFTAGQVTRMQAALDGDRSTIGHPKAELITVKFRDDGGIPTLKFREDQPPTLKFGDDGGTLKFLEDGGTFKFRDDIKQPALDKMPITDVKSPVFDIPQPIEFGMPAPFILSTPHHSMAWTGSFPGAHRTALAAAEAQLRAYEEQLMQYAEADQAGQLGPEDVARADQLYQEYHQLAEEYQQLSGG